MNFNSILLITFCLLQVLNCAVKLSEQTLKRALTKTLKSEINKKYSIKLSLPSEYTELNFTYSPLTSDNIKLWYHESTEDLHVEFVNLNVTVTGIYKEYIAGYKILTEFAVKLTKFYWEQEFDATKLYLGNRNFTPKREPSVDAYASYNDLTQKTKNIPEKIKDIIDSDSEIRKIYIATRLMSLDYNEVKIQLRKISQLLLQNLQSDLK